MPPEYAGRADDYVDLVTGPMLDACAPHARWIDVFCEPRRAFDGDQARAVLEAGRAAGLRPAGARQPARPGPGVQLASSSAPPAPTTAPTSTDADVDALAGGGRRSRRCCPASSSPPGRRIRTPARLLDAGVDGRAGHRLQPGLVLHLVDGVLHRPRRPRDADDPRRGAVVGDGRRGGGAAARPTSATWASGARADLAVLDAPSYLHLAYRPGVPLVRTLELRRGRLGACAR